MNKTFLDTTSEGANGAMDSDNPFVGLRPYEGEESFLFFGREKQTTELLKKLDTTHFIGVVGSSGCGKSSLIKAGLIPILKAGFLTGERANWMIASMRPGGHPLRFLAEAYNEAIHSSHLPAHHSLRRRQASYEDFKDKSIAELTECLQPVLDETRCNLLLLVDQFEELFTSRRKGISEQEQKNENISFVSLLLALARQRTLPIYIIVTMRSDYMGQCNQFYDLPEILNEGQYLVPRLNRHQLREVIEFPVKLFGEKITPRLLDLLLNDCDKDLDQLPVLQHCLMRTYKCLLDERLQGGTKGPLDFSHYEKAGRLDKALDNHAKEVYDSLDGRQQQIAKRVFKTITDVNAENEPIRRRQEFNEIMDVCQSIENITEDEVIAVIDKFRNPACAFLTPFTGKMHKNTFVDISHESLMRQWEDLKEWMKEEQDSGRKYLWLSESVCREYLRGIDLKDALSWQEKQRPNAAWASRYSANLKAVEDYIEESRRKFRMSRIRTIVLIALPVLACLWGYSMYRSNQRNKLVSKNWELKSKLDSVETAKSKQALIFANIQAKAQQDEKERIIEQEKETKILNAKLNDALNNANIKSKQLVRQQKELVLKNDEINKLLKEVNSNLNDEKFEKTTFNKTDKISYDLKQKGKQMLLPYLEAKKIENYENIVKSFNAIAVALDTAATNPAEALKTARRAFLINANEIVKTLALDLANTNLLYRQKSAVLEDENATPEFFVMTRTKDGFFFSEDGNIVQASIKKEPDSVAISKSFVYKTAARKAPSVTDTASLDSADTLSDADFANELLTSMNAADDGTVLTIENETLYRVANGSKEKLALLPGNSRTYYLLSPNGKWLFTYNSDSIRKQASLWEIDKLKANIRDSIPLGTSTEKVYSIAFSPDSKYIALGNEAIRLWDVNGHLLETIYHTESAKQTRAPSSASKNYLSERNSTDVATTLSFSDDGRQIAYATNFGKFNIWSIPEKKFLVRDPDDFRKEFSGDYVSKLKFSPDGKKLLLVSAYDGKLVCYMPDAPQKERIKRLVYHDDENSDNAIIIGSDFVDNNTVALFDYYGYLYTWNTDSRYNDYTQALAIIADKYREEESIDTLDIQKVLYSGDDKFLDTTALRYKKSSISEYSYDYEKSAEYSNKAKQLYTRLAEQSTGGRQQNVYLSQIIDLNQQLVDEELLNTKPDYYRIVEKLKENARLGDTILKNSYSSSNGLKDSVSKIYWNLSWYQLFAREFEGAVASAKKSIAIYSPNDGVITNMALGYLLSGQYKQADSLYQLYKNRMYSDGSGRYFVDAFQQDFNDLEIAGIISSREGELYQKVEKIRTMLRGGK